MNTNDTLLNDQSDTCDDVMRAHERIDELEAIVERLLQVILVEKAGPEIAAIMARRKGYRWVCQAGGHGIKYGSCESSYAAARRSLQSHADSQHGGSVAGSAISDCNTTSLSLSEANPSMSEPIESFLIEGDGSKTPLDIPESVNRQLFDVVRTESKAVILVERNWVRYPDGKYHGSFTYAPWDYSPDGRLRILKKYGYAS